MYIKHISLFKKIFNIKENVLNPIEIKTETKCTFNDTVKLSKDSGSKLHLLDQKTRDIIYNVPDIRKHKVEELKTKIHTQDYMELVDYNILINKMINSSFKVKIDYP